MSSLLLTIQHSFLHRRGLTGDGRRTVRSKVGAAFESKLGLDIDTLFQENALQQRILVPEHQTLISSSTVALLESLERFLMMLDGRFELLDVLCSSLTEGCLRLAISLLALL
jgi:hypothetical protein